MKKIIIFLAVTLFLFCGCSGSLSVIDIADVDKVEIWTPQSRREATAEEVANLIELYNASQYGGKATGEGGTPDFGATILLKNGNEIAVNDFASGKMEVFSTVETFYLESQDFYEALKKASFPSD